MPVKHGTNRGYTFYKCRCDACREAHRQAAAIDRERNSARINAYKRDRYAANPQPVRESNRKWREANPDKAREIDHAKYLKRRDRHLEVAKVHYQLNRQKYVDYARRWRAANRERYNELSREAYWRDPEKSRAQARKDAAKERERHPERVRARFREWAKSPQGRLYFRAQREMRRGVPYTEEALEWIASLVDPLCTYCGEPADSIDHIIAVTKGGTGERDNLTPACRSCNSKKRNLSLETFLERQGLMQ